MTTHKFVPGDVIRLRKDRTWMFCTNEPNPPDGSWQRDVNCISDQCTCVFVDSVEMAAHPGPGRTRGMWVVLLIDEKLCYGDDDEDLQFLYENFELVVPISTQDFISS